MFHFRIKFPLTLAACKSLTFELECAVNQSVCSTGAVVCVTGAVEFWNNSITKNLNTAEQ